MTKIETDVTKIETDMSKIETEMTKFKMENRKNEITLTKLESITEFIFITIGLKYP